MAPPPLAVRAALLVLAAILAVCSGDAPCGGADGLRADYAQRCREYVRCAGGAEAARYACEHGRAFSNTAGVCVPRALEPCVRRECAPFDRQAYAAPGTACRDYYRCENGTALEFSCPPGAWFDSERGACARGSGACYEPLCVGLTDGLHADPSHDCRRRLECRGGELNAVEPCPGGAERCPPPSGRCPAPRSAAVALPVGDDFCPDEACSAPCQLAEDGAHADRATGCRGYLVCASRRLVARGACDAGRLFSSESGACEPAAAVSCPRTARGRCYGRADRAYRDWRDCRSWFACRRERVVAHGTCDARLVWNGRACAATDLFHCEGPAASTECATRPSGFYRDLDSDCARFYHCEGLSRTNFSCPRGRVFDGSSCVPRADYLCPSLDPDSCYRKPDGKYGARGSSCRGYYACAAGVKSMYACAPGYAFDTAEGTCMKDLAGRCQEDASCAGLTDGYYRDESSGCRNYTYCEGSQRIATLRCSGSKLFDGKRCVEQSEYVCGARREEKPGVEAEADCSEDGFTVQPGTGCRVFHSCLGGARTELRCAHAHVFDGRVCVPEDSYTCPGG